MKVPSPEAQRRFITKFAEYLYAVINEPSDRANGRGLFRTYVSPCWWILVFLFAVTISVVLRP
jgi:hypothetical protein